MASITQTPAQLDLQYSLKETLSFPVTINYKSSSGTLTPVNLSSYTFAATAYRGGIKVPLAVAPTSLSTGVITIEISAGLLAAKSNWVWDLLATDALGNSRVLLAGAIAVTDVTVPGGTVLLSNFDNPAVL